MIKTPQNVWWKYYNTLESLTLWTSTGTIWDFHLSSFSQDHFTPLKYNQYSTINTPHLYNFNLNMTWKTRFMIWIKVIIMMMIIIIIIIIIKKQSKLHCYKNVKYSNKMNFQTVNWLLKTIKNYQLFLHVKVLQQKNKDG